MKIGIATPVSLHLLSDLVSKGDELPRGYEFPPHALLVREYLRRGHQVSVFTLAQDIEEPRVFLGDRLAIHVGRYRTSGRARDLFAAERRDLRSAMLSDPCDILHAHWTYEFALAAVESGQPHVITAHDAPLTIFKLYRDAYRLARTLMAWKAIRRARHITAVSPYIQRHLRRVFRYRGEIPIVPNGLPEEVFARGPVSSRTHTRAITFATVLTGWSRLKNGAVALEAFQHARLLLPQASLLMFGPDYGVGEAAQQWAQRRGLNVGVEFVGALSHGNLLDRLAAEVDVLLHPALEESFCISIAEGMALGLPVIAGLDSGAVPWTLDSGRAGRLVDVRSAEAVAAAMVDLAQHPHQRMMLGQAGRASAQRRFSLEQVVAAYESVYERVLKAS